MPNIYFYNTIRGRHIFNDIVNKFNTKEIIYRSNKKIPYGNLKDMRKNMIKYYQKNMINFTEEEKELITTIIMELKQKFTDKFPLIEGWKFVLLQNEPDNNLPYTLFDVIVLHKFPRNFREPQFRQDLEELLFHEQIHILQRKHPSVFDDFYLQKWNMININLKNKWIEDNRITNPDSNGKLYIKAIQKMGDYIIYVIPQMIIAYDNLEQVGIYLAYNLKNKTSKILYDKNNSVKIKKLHNIPQYYNSFKQLYNIYAPNEIFAHSVVEMIYSNESFEFINKNDLNELNNKLR
jgi:hypothetical protein